MNKLSTVKPMPKELEVAVLEDCNNILFNVFELSIEAHHHYMQCVDMCNSGASEEEVYSKLNEITKENI